MALTFDRQNYERMLRVQQQLAQVLNQANRDHVEAGIAAFALVRLASELFDQYPDATRKVLVEGTAIPFLRHEPVKTEGGILVLQ